MHSATNDSNQCWTSHWLVNNVSQCQSKSSHQSIWLMTWLLGRNSCLSVTHHCIFFARWFLIRCSCSWADRPAFDLVKVNQIWLVIVSQVILTWWLCLFSHDCPTLTLTTVLPTPSTWRLSNQYYSIRSTTTMSDNDTKRDNRWQKVSSFFSSLFSFLLYLTSYRHDDNNQQQPWQQQPTNNLHQDHYNTIQAWRRRR